MPGAFSFWAPWTSDSIGSPGTEGADLCTVPVASHKGLHTPEWKQRHPWPSDKTITPIVVDPYSWPAVVSERRRLGGVPT